MATLTRTVRSRRRIEAELAIGMLGNDSKILAVAKALKEATKSPVLGGVAVFLHGYRRTTVDLDLYTEDRRRTAREIEAAGAVWDSAKREHVLDGVRIHTVTPEDAGHRVEATSVVDGVRVVSLKDLIAIKLICGLSNDGRSKDLADVEELIRRVPLDKRFAGKLPSRLRADFKKFVDRVRANERSNQGRPRF